MGILCLDQTQTLVRFLEIGKETIQTAIEVKDIVTCLCNMEITHNYLIREFNCQVNCNKQASWLHAELFFVLVLMGFPVHHMVSM